MDLITKCNACEPPVREWLDTKTLNCWVDKIHLSALPPSLHTQQQILFIYFWLEVVHLLYLIMCWNYILQFTIYIYIYNMCFGIVPLLDITAFKHWFSSHEWSKTIVTKKVYSNKILNTQTRMQKAENEAVPAPLP